MQVARPHFQAGHAAEGLGHPVANLLDSLAPALARERQEGVQREEIAGLDGGQQRVERLVQILTALEHGREGHFHTTHVYLVGEHLSEIGLGLAILQDVEHLGLRGGHVGLVERTHLHEIAAHGDGVLPHDEVLGQLFHGIDAVVQPRDSRVDVSEAHLEVAALVPQVGLGLVHDDGPIARVFREQQRVDLDVRQNALTVLAQRLGHQLLDPQAQHAPALGGEERELVAALQVIVVEERRQVDGRVVDGVFRTGLLGLAGVGHEGLHIDTRERRRHQPEYRESRETASHRGLTGEHGAPALLAGLAIEVATRVGDGDQVLHHVLAELLLEGGAHGLQQHARLDGTAALRGDDDQRAMRIADGEHLAHAHGRVGIQRAELHPSGIVFVVFRDGHGRLSGTALADEQNGVETRFHHLVGESLDSVHVAQGAGGQIDPSHVVARARLRLGGEIVQRGVLGMNAACRTSFHQGLCRRIQLLNVNGEHGAPLLSGQFPPASRIANGPLAPGTGAPPR